MTHVNLNEFEENVQYMSAELEEIAFLPGNTFISQNHIRVMKKIEEDTAEILAILEELDYNHPFTNGGDL